MTNDFLECVRADDIMPLLDAIPAYLDRPLVHDGTLLCPGPKLIFLPRRPSLRHTATASVYKTSWYRLLLNLLSHAGWWTAFVPAYLSHVEALQGEEARVQLAVTLAPYREVPPYDPYSSDDYEARRRRVRKAPRTEGPDGRREVSFSGGLPTTAMERHDSSRLGVIDTESDSRAVLAEPAQATGASSVPGSGGTTVTSAASGRERANMRRQLLSDAIIAAVLTRGPFVKLPPWLLGEACICFPISGTCRVGVGRNATVVSCGSAIFYGGASYRLRPMSELIKLTPSKDEAGGAVGPAMLTVVLRRLALERHQLLLPITTASGVKVVEVPGRNALPFRGLRTTAAERLVGIPIVSAGDDDEDSESRANAIAVRCLESNFKL